MLEKGMWQKKSIRTKSLFENGKLTLLESPRLVFYYFLQDFTLEEIYYQTGISKTTSGQLYTQLRELISEYIQAMTTFSPFQTFDNKKLVVEADESLFTHSNGQQMWVFGLYCRNKQEARCFSVVDRSSEVLISIINDHVPIGSHIYTDGWASYIQLPRLGFTHTIVNHREGFGYGDNTTNHIESLWSELKNLTNHDKGIKTGKERPLEILQHHIDTGLWRRMYKHHNLVHELINVIKFFY